MYKRRNEDITTDEARALMEPYGALSKVEFLDEQLRLQMNIPVAVLVEFALFSASRDLNSVSF